MAAIRENTFSQILSGSLAVGYISEVFSIDHFII